MLMLDADKKDTSSLAQAALEGNRCEIVRVFDIIEATEKCQFCDYRYPTSHKVGNNPNLLDFAQAALSYLPCSDSNLLSDRGLL